MILGFTILLGCQLAGEVLTRGLGLPVPGPVIGLSILFLGFWLRRLVMPGSEGALMEGSTARVADGLLLSLAFLFVPAGVGVVDQLPLLGTYKMALGAALIGSTVLTLGVTVGTFVLVKRWLGRREGAES